MLAVLFCSVQDPDVTRGLPVGVLRLSCRAAFGLRASSVSASSNSRVSRAVFDFLFHAINIRCRLYIKDTSRPLDRDLKIALILIPRSTNTSGTSQYLTTRSCRLTSTMPFIAVVTPPIPPASKDEFLAAWPSIKADIAGQPNVLGVSGGEVVGENGSPVTEFKFIQTLGKNNPHRLWKHLLNFIQLSTARKMRRHSASLHGQRSTLKKPRRRWLRHPRSESSRRATFPTQPLKR